jgi:hypothetical protein
MPDRAMTNVTNTRAMTTAASGSQRDDRGGTAETAPRVIGLSVIELSLMSRRISDEGERGTDEDGVRVRSGSILRGDAIAAGGSTVGGRSIVGDGSNVSSGSRAVGGGVIAGRSVGKSRALQKSSKFFRLVATKG